MYMYLYLGYADCKVLYQ